MEQITEIIKNYQKTLDSIEESRMEHNELSEQEINQLIENQTELLSMLRSSITINNDQSKKINTLETKIKNTLDFAFEYAQIDGAHHKTWTIDQMVQTLTEDQYQNWIKKYETDEKTGDKYTWDQGIAP